MFANSDSTAACLEDDDLTGEYYKGNVSITSLGRQCVNWESKRYVTLVTRQVAKVTMQVTKVTRQVAMVTEQVVMATRQVDLVTRWVTKVNDGNCVSWGLCVVPMQTYFPWIIDELQIS